MNIFYDSYERFCHRIKKTWRKSGFAYHYGHEQILRFAWWTRLYWGNIRNDKVSGVNRVETTLRLF